MAQKTHYAVETNRPACGTRATATTRIEYTIETVNCKRCVKIIGGGDYITGIRAIADEQRNIREMYRAAQDQDREEYEHGVLRVRYGIRGETPTDAEIRELRNQLQREPNTNRNHKAWLMFELNRLEELARAANPADRNRRLRFAARWEAKREAVADMLRAAGDTRIR